MFPSIVGYKSGFHVCKVNSVKIRAQTKILQYIAKKFAKKKYILIKQSEKQICILHSDELQRYEKIRYKCNAGLHIS